MQEHPGKPQWGYLEELVAQLIELTSVMAAERRLAKPIEAPRPDHIKPAKKGKGMGFREMLAHLKANGGARYAPAAGPTGE